MITQCITILRRIIQSLAVLILVLLPILALYTHFKEAHALHDLAADTWQHAAVRHVEQVVRNNPQLQSAVERSQGTFWSARILGISISDPLAGVEAILSSRTFYKPMLWSLVIPLVLSLLLGRVFCGWICPMNTLLEINDQLRRLLSLAEVRERDVRFSLNTKYLVLAIVLGLVAFTSVPFIAMFYPPAMLSREVHLLVFRSTIGLGVYLLLAICVIELLVSKRWWCRYICPGGALYSLLGRFRLVRVVRDEKKCTQCGNCVRACQFALRPMLVQVTGMECTNCAACIKACDDDALHYQLVLPRPPTAESRHSDNARKTATTATRVLLAAVFGLGALAATPAAAHHILGLPHYSYKENYPQAPTLEYPATSGPYDLLMTSFPGQPVPGERTTIAFYIKNRTTGQPYDQPVSLRVLQTRMFGGNQLIVPPMLHEPTTNEHKYFVTFPRNGEFIAELTLEVEGKPEVIPFLMVAGQTSARKSTLIATLVGVGAFLVVVRAIRIKRQRLASPSAAHHVPQGIA